MRSTKAFYRLLCFQIPLAVLLLLSGCGGAIGPAPNTSIFPNIPTQSSIHEFDLPAQQQLRDITGALSVRQRGADTGILVVPGERIQIFATGTAYINSTTYPSGPDGDAICEAANAPILNLPCDSVIYSIGFTGTAHEVGKQTTFIATTTGNLFLGVNASHVKSNAGSFHIKLLSLPRGTVEGLWDGLDNGFTVQGTSIKLSAHIFPQNVSINKVQFILLSPGKAAMPICDISAPDSSDSARADYSCDWGFRTGVTYQVNGSITVGFTIYYGNQQQSLKQMINPDGVRSGVMRYAKTVQSSNYAGYDTTDMNTDNGKNQNVSATWKLPQIPCRPGETSAVGVWVGMTNGASDRSLLAQLGSGSVCDAGDLFYYLWWEMYPAPPVLIDTAEHPGDIISARVAFQDGHFQLSIDDPNAGVHFSTTKPGKASDTRFAECIVEPPFHVDNQVTNSGHLEALPNFGNIRVTCHANNGPIGTGPQNEIFQMIQNSGDAKATTSPLDKDGATFTVKWHHS
jgi:hypothetical protein